MKFTVVTPVYNGERFIGRCIESVINQIHTDWELIVINDGSTDNTFEIISKYSKEEPRMRVINREENSKRPAVARNIGLREARGECIAFLDADDIYYPEKLIEVSRTFEKFEDVDLICHGEKIFVDGKAKKVEFFGPYTKYEDLLFFGNSLSTSAVAIRKSCLDKVGYFSEKNEFRGVEDYDLWMCIAKLSKIFYLKKVLGEYNIRNNSVSSNIAEHCENSLFLLSQHFCNWEKHTARYRHLMRRRKSLCLRNAAKEFFKIRDFYNAKRYLKNAILTHPLILKNYLWLAISFSTAIFENLDNYRFSYRVMLKNILFKILYYCGAKHVYRCSLSTSNCAILAYHRVAPMDVKNIFLKDMIVEPKKFEKQVIYLKKKYNIISLAQLMDLLSQGMFFPANSAVITFDDGYEDNYKYAFPILRKYNLPATVFISTAFIDDNYRFWWDTLNNMVLSTRKKSFIYNYREKVYDFKLNTLKEKELFFESMVSLFKEMGTEEELKFLNILSELLEVELDCACPRGLSWHQLKEMLDNGIDFGAHCHTHRSLNILKNPELLEEVSRPKNILEKGLGRSIFGFAIPYGEKDNYNNETIAAIKEAGYKIVLTMTQGLVFDNDGVFSLGRIGIGGNDTDEIFKLKVAGFVTWTRSILRGVSGN